MNTKPLVLVVVVASLAIAAWFAWRGGGDLVTRPNSPTMTQNGGSIGLGTAEIDAGDVASDPAGAESLAGRVSVSERTDAGLAGNLPGESRATTHGRLVDGDGQALADVAMRRRLARNPDRMEFFGGQFGASTEDFSSGPDGRFSFSLASDQSAILELANSEFVFEKDEPTIHGFKGNQDLGDLIVRSSAIVAGIVKDERDAPVAGVKVSAARGAIGIGGMSSDTTGEDGRFRLGKLRPGAWSIRTASAQYLPTTADVTVEDGTRVDDLILFVAAGQAIAGQVVDDLGRGVADFRVGAKRTEARGGIDIERFAADEAATTDANGFFSLAGLAGETATVRAFGPGHTAAFAPDVKVGTGNLLLQVDRLAAVEGVLRGVDGGVLAGSTVRAIPAGNDAMLTAHGIEGVLQDRAATAKTAADGTFRIEGVQPGTVTVAAEGKGHRPARQTGIQVAPAQVIQGVQLVADRGAVVHLTVVDEDGQPVAAARVRVEKPQQAAGSGSLQVRSRRVEDNDGEVRVFGGDDSLGSAVTDAEGRAVIQGLPAGSAALYAEHDDFAKARPVTLPLLPNGSVETILTLRTPGYAEVHVTGPDGTAVDGALFQVRGPLGASDSDSRGGKTDGEGAGVVGPLAAGNYLAELKRKPGLTDFGGATILLAGDEGSAIGGTEQRFTVTAGKTTIVEIRRPTLTRVFGTVTGVDGPVAGCTVEIENHSSAEPAHPGIGAPRSATTSADGTFSIEDVEGGSYVMRYGRQEQIVKAETPLNVPAELPELRQDLVLRTGKIRVQAWSQVEDRAIPGAEVAISRARSEVEPERRQTRVMMVAISTTDTQGDSTMMTMGAQRAKAGADGWAEIEDVPVGDYDVRITHGSYVPGEKKAVVVNELQTTDLGRVEMTQAGKIRGRVLDGDGNPVGMGLVFHRPVGGEEGQPTPAMGGTFTIDALPTGHYLLRAKQMGSNGPAAYCPEVEVEVMAGETTTADLRLPKK